VWRGSWVATLLHRQAELEVIHREKPDESAFVLFTMSVAHDELDP
jgi:hypothetical protein